MLFPTAVMSISSRMYFLHLFLCSRTFVWCPCSPLLLCAPQAVNASFIHISSPVPFSLLLLSLPLLPASALVTNIVSRLICDSVIQNPRTMALLKGPCLSSLSKIKSFLVPRSQCHRVEMTGGLEYGGFPFPFPVHVPGTFQALFSFSPGKVDREGLSPTSFLASR